MNIPHYTLRLVQECTQEYASDCARSEAESACILRAMIGDRPNEHLVALFVNGQNKIVGSHIVAIGSQHRISVTTHDVFRAAIAANASAIILGHNHPSGDPTPSPEDREFTQKVVQSGEILGITLLDHIIVTMNSHRSITYA